MLKRNYRRTNKQKRNYDNKMIRNSILHQHKVKRGTPKHLKLVWLILTKKNEIKIINDRTKLQEIIDIKKGYSLNKYSFFNDISFFYLTCYSIKDFHHLKQLLFYTNQMNPF